ncbi:MAG: chorismate mutase [Oscillospiraceae bacterium]|nr:chorismate mutase [Oscillospiraceae bacterium]
MDLTELRNRIDDIDSSILDLFVKRMNICRQVADYKRENNLPVMQGNREEQVLERIRKLAPDDLADGSAVLFSEIMDISKCIQHQELLAKTVRILEPKLFLPKMARTIACPGILGSNTEMAARKLFPTQEIRYFSDFEDVFRAVENKEVDFGVIPIQNSTAGNVTETYDLMAKHNFYITSMIRLDICHCLAVKKGTSFMDISKVISHPQALSQCSDFLHENCFETSDCANTSIAAKRVADSSEPVACICNEHCAELYGLEILNKDIANAEKNVTRFICIAKDFYATEQSQTISVSLSIPHTKGSLYRLLTKFSINGFNLERIENKPIAGKDFEVIFYLDFNGRYDDIRVCALMDELENDLTYFKFLGNYSEIM